MVLPPNAAERVALSKSSAMTMPGPEGCAMWTMAVDNAAGQHQALFGVNRLRSAGQALASATMRPPRMPTSALKVSDAVAPCRRR
jgi:hypothetical protein